MSIYYLPPLTSTFVQFSPNNTFNHVIRGNDKCANGTAAYLYAAGILLSTSNAVGTLASVVWVFFPRGDNDSVSSILLVIVMQACFIAEMMSIIWVSF